MQPLPRLPTEIWEGIIDCIDIDPWYFHGGETGILSACTLVCRSWHTRATLNLYRKFETKCNRLSNLQKTLRNNSSMFSLPNAIHVICTTTSISAFFIESKFKNLRFLALSFLDLANEHVLITRGPLSHSVTELRLWDLHSCTVSGLLRFLNSFHSLSDLDISFRGLLPHTGQILPRPHPIPSRSLKTLSLGVVPGVGKVIDWYIREGYFLASLKKLQLSWEYYLGQHEIHFEVPALLPHQCMDTLEELTLSVYSDINKDSFVNGFSRNGMFRYIHHTTLSHQ